MLPKIIDLFSGCGGLALGFEKAGFEIAAGLELMPKACETINQNLSLRYSKKTNHICGDITKLEGDCFKSLVGPEGCIVIGGPPCQAYSMAGRGKMMSLGEDKALMNDARGYLFKDYLRFVYGMDARAVVMENVPEATKFGTMNIPEIVCEDLISHGYKAYWTVITSADYGVPQIRSRIILFGIKESEEKNIELPIPTNKPQDNIKFSRRYSDFEKYPHFVKPNLPANDLPYWNTVGNAFSDLPRLFPTIDSIYKARALTEKLEYRTEIKNYYQEQMRNWYNKKTEFVTANTFRRTKRDIPIFDRMKQGDDYFDASVIADALLSEKAKELRIKAGTKTYEKLKKEIVPPYDRKRFQGKWRRLDENLPSHTVIAHMCKDTYSYIHPWEPRGISVREAARLQSFPDDFQFTCSMSDAFKQIGNAVPPLRAYGIAKTVLKTYGGNDYDSL